MASGDTLFILDPISSVPPAANAASLDHISDGSTPGLQIPVLRFDGSTNEHRDWYVTIPSHYSGTTGFTFSYKYALDANDNDTVELEFRVLPFADQGLLTGDLGIDTQTAVAVQDTPPAGNPTNDLQVTGTGALAKANFGSAGADTRIVIRATRDTAVATNTADLQLLEVVVKET